MAPAKKPINWQEVELSMMAGSTQRRIAGSQGVDEDTLCTRFKEEYGCLYSEYADKMRSKGDALLEAELLKKALKGSIPVLLWLSKCRLGFKEPDQGTQQYTTIKIKTNDRLRTGVRVQPEGLPDTSDRSPEQGDEESGSSMAPTFG